MDKERELFHRLLDGELSSTEDREILEWITADPKREQEFEELENAVLTAVSCPKLQVDASFTREVMKKLPSPKRNLGTKAVQFLFGQRVLRWNFATAAAVCVVMIVSLIFFQGRTKPPTAPPESSKTIDTVRLAYYAPEAKTVSLAGDFNKWSINEWAMKKQKDGTWVIEIPLKPGVYHYMFVVDGEGWVTDPRAESYRDDGFGNRNAVLRINNQI